MYMGTDKVAFELVVLPEAALPEVTGSDVIFPPRFFFCDVIFPPRFFNEETTHLKFMSSITITTRYRKKCEIVHVQCNLSKLNPE